MLSDLSGSVSLGLFTATASGIASMSGSFSLGYCPSCDGTYLADNYERAGENSTFYFSRGIGYDLNGALSLTAGMPGVEVGAGVTLGISDANVFDEEPPVILLPNAQSLIDSMKFSPQTAVSKSLSIVAFPYYIRYSIFFGTCQHTLSKICFNLWTRCLPKPQQTKPSMLKSLFWTSQSKIFLVLRRSLPMPCFSFSLWYKTSMIELRNLWLSKGESIQQQICLLLSTKLIKISFSLLLVKRRHRSYSG